MSETLKISHQTFDLSLSPDVEDLTRTEDLKEELSEFSQLETGSPVKPIVSDGIDYMKYPDERKVYLREVAWNFRHYQTNIYLLNIAAGKLAHLL